MKKIILMALILSLFLVVGCKEEFSNSLKWSHDGTAPEGSKVIGFNQGALISYANEQECRNACVDYCGENKGSYKEIKFQQPKWNDVYEIKGKELSFSSDCWCSCRR